jgi:sodium-coupled monocarboxylate transporter 8/12
VPYLVLDVLGGVPGLPGLFVSTIYSAALSSISSGMNSLAAVCITDFVRPAYGFIKKKPIEEKLATIVTRALALGFGAGAIGFAIVIQYLGDTVLQLVNSIFGLLGGPLLGVISLGIFVPSANWVVSRNNFKIAN